jgi:hypothetical protein
MLSAFIPTPAGISQVQCILKVLLMYNILNAVLICY